MLPWRQALSPIWSHRLRLAGAEVKVKHETGVHFGCNLCWYEWCTWTSWCLPGSRTWWRDVTDTWVQCITQKQQLIYTWLIGIISIFPNRIFFKDNAMVPGVQTWYLLSWRARQKHSGHVEVVGRMAKTVSKEIRIVFKSKSWNDELKMDCTCDRFA